MCRQFLLYKFWSILSGSFSHQNDQEINFQVKSNKFLELPSNFVLWQSQDLILAVLIMVPSLSRFLWPCRDKFQVAARANWNATFGLAWSQCCFASAYWSWNGWSLESSKSNWMSQHCQRDMTNTPSRPMKLLGCPRVPRAVSNPPPWPLAGWTQVPGTCGFDSWECSWEHCGNLRFMPCKKIGFHEKFLGIVSFGCLEPCK